MRTEYFDFYDTQGNILSAVIWQPEEVKAVIQVTHGMTEHMGRYEAFAAHMARQGVAVAGFDLRGHGRNAGDPDVASLGDFGWKATLSDMQMFREHLRQLFPKAKHFMLGFSLGSFLLRDYLNANPMDDLAGAVIMGTGHQPGWLLAVMLKIVRGQVKQVGFDQTSDLIRQLSFGAYNQKCKPNRTTADWLCANEEAVDDYLADPLVRKDISSGLFWDLLSAMKRQGTAFEYDGWDTDLPILLLSGQDDPVGNQGKGVAEICRRMTKAGMERVTMDLIPGARHDVLHEGKNCEEIIARWIRDVQERN